MERWDRSGGRSGDGSHEKIVPFWHQIIDFSRDLLEQTPFVSMLWFGIISDITSLINFAVANTLMNIFDLRNFEIGDE